MEDKDKIKELFSQKLGNFEAKVDPSLWNGIASQLGATATTVASTGMSLLSKIIIGVSFSVAVITTGIILLPKNSQKIAKIPAKSLNKIEANIVTNKNVIKNKETKTTSVVEIQNDEITEKGIKVKTEKVFEMPISEFEEGIIDEDCIGCDLVERVEQTKIEDLSKRQEEIKISEQEKTSKEEENIQEESVPYIPASNPVYYIEQYTNVFSPNNDGINDNFSLKIEGLEDFQISILDFKSQKEIFQARDTNFTWNGTDQFGNPVGEGDYLYMINALDVDGNPIREIKSLRIAR